MDRLRPSLTPPATELMIDIHCHMLPGIDDGARDLNTALVMARLAVEDGITTTICTPHIYPGLFENTVEGIQQAVVDFRQALQVAKIPLEVTYGADIQITPELVQGLRTGSLPTLHHSRYFLFEPPHHIAPPGMLDLLHNVILSGYVPVVTHPERLSYVEEYYDQFLEAASMGAWLQLTGGSLLGRFGPGLKRSLSVFWQMAWYTFWPQMGTISKIGRQNCQRHAMRQRFGSVKKKRSGWSKIAPVPFWTI